MKQFKTSFVLHDDSLSILDELSDDEAGKLFKAIAKAHKYIVSEKTEMVNDTNLGLSRLEWILFKPFYNQLLRDFDNYNQTVAKNRENGKKGGRPKQSKEKPKKPNGLNGNPKNPDSDSDSDSEKDNGNDSVTDKESDSVSLHESIDVDLWNDFLLLRKKLKAPNTERAINGLINKLNDFIAKGYNPNEIIQTSYENGWKSFFEPKKNKGVSNLAQNIATANEWLSDTSFDEIEVLDVK